MTPVSFASVVDGVLGLDARELQLVIALAQSLLTGTNDQPIRWTPIASEVK